MSIDIAQLTESTLRWDGGTTTVYFIDASGVQHRVAAVAPVFRDDAPREWAIGFDGAAVEDDKTLAELLAALRPFAGPGSDWDAGTPEQKSARIETLKSLDVEEQRQWMLTAAAETVVHHIEEALGRLRA
jgi:hypothetical protein